MLMTLDMGYTTQHDELSGSASTDSFMINAVQSILKKWVKGQLSMKIENKFVNYNQQPSSFRLEKDFYELF